MAGKADSSITFSLAQARHIVKDFFKPNPAIYWADFLISASCGLICFGLVRRVLTPFSISQAIVFLLCGIFYYRAVSFTHELTHLRDQSFRGFRIVWNLLCGIPFLMPSFMYYTHLEHHMRKNFGTDHDGEYLPLGSRSRWHILMYLSQSLVIPALAVSRFLILAPLTWLSPTIRDFVHRRASALVIDPTYIRPLPTRKVLRIYRLQEALCFAWSAGVTVLLVTGLLPISFLITTYLLAVLVLFMNSLRTLGAHRYIHDGEELTFVEQLLDSVNYPRRPFLTEVWMPVGLRFHALHHLFPSMPYHNLAAAHDRLMAELPIDSPYRLTESPGLIASLCTLWNLSRASERKATPTEGVDRRYRAAAERERHRPESMRRAVNG